MWKRLKHPNIVPLLGATTATLQLVSVCMPGGGLLGYIETHPSVDRLGFVGSRYATSNCAFTPFAIGF